MRKKIFWIVLVLICVILYFSFESFAAERLNEPEFFTDDKVNLSGTIGELNIVPMQVILQGETIQMTVEELSETSMAGVVEWSSSNPYIISCTKGGKIEGLLEGKAIITVKAKNGRAKDSITVYCAKKLDNSISTTVASPIAWSKPSPELFKVQHLFLQFLSPTLRRKSITVKGYYGSCFYITYEMNGETYKGYIWSALLSPNIASDEIFKQLSTYRIVVFPGETSTQKLTTNYEGSVKWSVYDEKIVSFDKNTGNVTAKSPGVTTITATVGTKMLTCMVFSVSRWNDPESSLTEKEVKVLDIPANTGKTIATLSKGTEIMADGDLENGLGWIHITSDNISGFIEVSDFPGIDYLMTEYHYYDEGFDTRYDSAHSKIESYTYILNEIMMDTFNLKVCSYIEPFTSSADRCKIWKYGSVSSDNLYAVCPKTGKHVADSCLLRSNMLSDLATKKGKGTKVIGRCLWTGHILENHEGSGATDKSNVIIFTTRNCTYGVGNQILDSSSTEIRDTRLYEIVHETGHLLGAVDGYCMGAENGGHCSNENCYECNEMAIPTCIMIQPFNPENSAVVFCNDCKSTINNHLKNHH